MTSPTSPTPSPAPSAPPQTYTPYPNVLNPVDDTHTPMAPFAPPMTRSSHQTAQQQRQPCPSLPSTSQSFQFDSYTAPPSLPPSQVDSALEIDLGAYHNLFLASSGFEQVVFPGWFVTSFDEHNLFSGTKLQEEHPNSQQEILGQGILRGQGTYSD